jgi:hypothetical protein
VEPLDLVVYDTHICYVRSWKERPDRGEEWEGRVKEGGESRDDPKRKNKEVGPVAPKPGKDGISERGTKVATILHSSFPGLAAIGHS